MDELKGKLLILGYFRATEGDKKLFEYISERPRIEAENILGKREMGRINF